MARTIGIIGLAMMIASSLWLAIALSGERSNSIDGVSAAALNETSPGLAGRLMAREMAATEQRALALQLWPALFIAGAVFVGASLVARERK